MTEQKPKKPKKLVIKVDNHTFRITETDLPHEGRVKLSDPKVKERGPKQELVVYATADETTYQPGRVYACYFNMKGKLEGYFTIN